MAAAKLAFARRGRALPNTLSAANTHIIAGTRTMRISTYRYNGTTTYGVVSEDGFIDVGGDLGGKYPGLLEVIAAGALDEVARTAERRSPEALLDEVTYLPVIPEPGKIIAAGLNYEKHRIETNSPKDAYVTLFIRLTDTLLGHRQPVLKPTVSNHLDFEGELALVIGKAGRGISEADALSHVAGYTCFNDVSVRDWQSHTGQITPGKNFPASGPLGPWLVTADEIPDPAQLTLTTRLNGEVVQNAPTNDLIFSVSEIIAYVSAFTPLAPGDVILRFG